MKKITMLALFAITLLLVSCKEQKSNKVDLTGFSIRNEIVHDTKLAAFSVNKEDVLQYCKDEDDGEPNDFIYRQLVQYISSSTANPVIINDTLGTIVDSIVFDSVTTVRDPKSPHSNVTDAFRRALLTLAEKGKVKVLDKISGKAVEYIKIKRVETKDYGETNIHVPNDSLIFSHLRWIK